MHLRCSASLPPMVLKSGPGLPRQGPGPEPPSPNTWAEAVVLTKAETAKAASTRSGLMFMPAPPTDRSRWWLSLAIEFPDDRRPLVHFRQNTVQLGRLERDDHA